LAKEGEEVYLLNPQARHNLAVGIFHRFRLVIEGSVGYFGASLGDGPEIYIRGNAGWALGDNMMDGTIHVAKNAGASCGCTIRGGEIFVGGNAGARCGISMKGGLLLVRGNAGYLTGFMMQKGRIIVCGDVGDAVGDSMYEGVIYVAGKTGELGNDAKFEDMDRGEADAIGEILDRHEISGKLAFRKIVSAKRLYHFDKLELLERQVV
ncbi:MAG: GXGXG motif-containing protein, partial [Nitrospinota bacterium]